MFSSVSRQFQMRSVRPLAFALSLILSGAFLTAGAVPTPVKKASVAAASVHHATTAVKPPVKKTLVVAATVSPNAFIAPYNLAVGLLRQEQYPEAEKSARKSLTLITASRQSNTKNLGEVDHLLGSILYRQMGGHPDKAIASIGFLKKAFAILSQPQNKTGSELQRYSELRMLGQLQMNMGFYPEAETSFKTALALQTPTPAEASDIEYMNSMITLIDKMDTGPNYLATDQPIAHWRDPVNNPIKVYITQSSELPDWKAEDVDAVKAAYAEWAKAVGLQVRFAFVDSPDVADVTVSWVPQVMHVAESSEVRDGVCQTLTTSDQIVRVGIVLALHRLDGQPGSYNHLHNVALHEIGHSLGIFHGHSTNPSDIMYPSDEFEMGKRRSLSARDIATVQKLYSLPAQVTNPPGIPLNRFSEYYTLRNQAITAYNAKDYQTAVTGLEQALAIYNQEADTQFFTGLSWSLLEHYQKAQPYLTYAGDHPGKYQADAIAREGFVMMKIAELQANSGDNTGAEKTYTQAATYLNTHLQTLTTESEDTKQIRKELGWISQHQSGNVSTVGESGEYGSSINIGNLPDGNAAPAKKKGWRRFLDDSQSGVPLNIALPAGMHSY